MEPHSLQQIDRELTYWTRERLKLTHPLRQLFWECTLRCNLSCLHCGSECIKGGSEPEMPLEQFLPVLDEVKQHQPRISTIVFTVGGEPLVRKDIVDCGRAITQKGFYWGMVSNGMLIDGPMMKALSEAGLRSLSIDIDGLRPEHNWLRQNEHSFDRAMAAIEHIRQAPHLVWDVITCVNSRNIDSLEEMKKLFIEAGIRRWRCFTIVPMGRADGNDELLIDDGQLKALMDFIVRTRREGRINVSYACEGFLGKYEGLVRRHHYSCHAGLTVASVRSNGDVSGCLSIRSSYHQGNIFREGGFWNIWQNRFQNYRNREWMRTGPCKECNMFHYCEGNGMHLRRDDGSLMLCHYNKLNP